MSKEAVTKIKEAEDEALRIKNDAVAKSKQMVEDAEKSGKAHLSSVELKTSAEYEAKLTAMRAAADRAVEKSRTEADAEAEALSKSAGLRMHKAINVIVGGIIEECR